VSYRPAREITGGPSRTHTLYPLRIVHEPLKAWIAQKAADKGGRPANAERRFMIERLAEAASHIFGSAPPVSVTSPFVALCERVLLMCGFAGEGIDKAIVAALSRSRKRGVRQPGGPAPMNALPEGCPQDD
jgi:hypothetical protein